MAIGRRRQKAKRKSRKNTRHSLEDRHRLGISATARAIQSNSQSAKSK